MNARPGSDRPETGSAGQYRASDEIATAVLTAVVALIAEVATECGAHDVTHALTSGDTAAAFDVADTYVKTAGDRWSPGARRMADLLWAISALNEPFPDLHHRAANVGVRLSILHPVVSAIGDCWSTAWWATHHHIADAEGLHLAIGAAHDALTRWSSMTVSAQRIAQTLLADRWRWPEACDAAELL